MSKFSRFITVSPNVHKADRGVEAVEHYQRQRQVIQNTPQNRVIEFISFVIHVSIFHGKCIINPQRNVGGSQESHEFTTRFVIS